VSAAERLPGDADDAYDAAFILRGARSKGTGDSRCPKAERKLGRARWSRAALAAGNR
jgi:hypothetical protein